MTSQPLPDAAACPAFRPLQPLGQPAALRCRRQSRARALLRAAAEFFGSLHATLNHILVGDSIWLGRFKGAIPAHIIALDQILHQDFDSLREAREAKDAEILAFCDGLDETALAGSFSYANMSGKRFTDPLAMALAHFFNHQTHHRGQAHDQLSHEGIEPPALDMIYFVREPGAESG